MVTIEAGGLLKARNIDIITDIVKVDKKGSLSLTGQGHLAGTGAGAGRSGGGYGGRGGTGNTAGKLIKQLCPMCSSLIYAFMYFSF